ncbi:hypothetical protein V0288_24955 [Pannus brasiliensis CCIBt3594]|uniref:Uncharacterized protein n=1 Tax=Pannus brasiliensis CCIBt3594 TaxID=1427578 RepID=A0AAW9R0F1_9CHRO
MSDRIDTITIRVTRKNLAFGALVVLIYSLGLIAIYELFYRVEVRGKINPDGSIEYRLK